MHGESIEALIAAKTTIEPKTGVPVEGGAFWSRPEQMLELIQRIEEGGSASLFGLRRIGKSSIMREAARHLRTRDYRCVMLNTEGMSGPGRLLVDLVQNLDPRLRDKIATAWAENGSLSGALKRLAAVIRSEPTDTANHEKDFRDFWEPLTQTVERQIRERGERIVLFIDELPFFLGDQMEKGATKQNVIDILATLRRWRQDGGIMSQVLTGSIGMAGFLRLHGIDRDHNNDAPGIHIPPLDPEDAASFLDAVAAGREIRAWGDPLRRAVLDRAIELYPSVLQEMMLLLKTEERLLLARKQTADAEAMLARLDAAVMPKIRKGFEAEFLNQFDKRRLRLSKFHETWPDVAIRMLRAVRDQNGLSRESAESMLGEAGLTEGDRVTFCEILREDAFVIERSDGAFALGDRIVDAWLSRRHGGAGPEDRR